MFFVRKKPHQLTFAERLDALRQAGFIVENLGEGSAKASNNGCAALIRDGGDQPPRLGKAGILVGSEIGELVDGGFQKFIVTPHGQRLPAQAYQLRALHDFDEDLKEALGLTSFYNESLGTTSDQHLYDRVQGRDRGVRRPWQH